MITPQQIDQISFSQTRHGYDMEQVDKILEPLTEDYVTLYKENALLKSKMRVLVGKLEEYRKNEAAAQNAMESARASAEKMIQDAKAQAAQLVRQAQAQAASVPAAAPTAAPPPRTPVPMRWWPWRRLGLPRLARLLPPASPRFRPRCSSASRRLTALRMPMSPPLPLLLHGLRRLPLPLPLLPSLLRHRLPLLLLR